MLTHNCGVGGNIAGRGADLFIVDDPHSEQDAQSPSALESAWDWYQSGPRQRLQPGGAIVVVMTRWGETDLTARLIKQQGMDPKADQWEVIELPAILPDGKPLWPEYWKLEELEKVKASISLSKWQAQYMQQPTADSVSIVKREWWRKWEKTEIPRLHYVMQSYDTAFLKTRTADFSAIQTWGVFYPVEDGPANVILLDAKKGRWEFPDLKRIAFNEYQYWEPETVLIESKAAGLPLTQELRSMGIPVVNYSPSRGNDKFSRLNSVAPLFESGLIWYPDTSWAEEVIEEIAAFPNGEHDDHCLTADTLVTMADGSQKPITEVRVGDYVLTPSGPKPVSFSGQTGVQPVFELVTTHGSVFSTINHPFFSEGGWKRLDDLVPGDRLELSSQESQGPSCLSSRLETLLSRLSSLRDAAIAGIRSLKGRLTGDTSPGRAISCTGTFGNFTTGLSLRDSRSTISTVTHPTTTSQTSNSSLMESMLESTPKAGLSAAGAERLWSIFPPYERRQKRGTPARKESHGIASTPEGLYTGLERQSPSLNALSCPGRASGAAGASPQRALRRLFALLAARLRSPSSCLVRQVRATHTTQPVYNLTVEQVHCFYANGILTKNCDAAAQALMRFRQGGFITHPEDYVLERTEHVGRRVYY